MKVIVSGKNMAVTDSLREGVESKFMKFDKYFKSDVEAHVTLSYQDVKTAKNCQIVEVTIPLKNGVIFRGEENSDDMYTAIDKVIDKLKRQMDKHKTKIERRYHKNDTIRFENIPELEEEAPEQKIVRTKQFSVKPMDAEEAVLQMEMLGHDFYVFMNHESEEINVVYLRKDGQYGLIEPTR